MKDDLMPTSLIANLWDKPDALQLLAYILKRADGNGVWEYQPLTTTVELSLPAKTIIDGLKVLERMQVISKCNSYTYRLDVIQQPTITTAIMPDEYQSFADTFNRKVKGTAIPQIRGLSETRKKAVRSRAKEYGGLTALEDILDKVVASDFLSGRKTDFCASFDWIFKKANFIKILEGNYDNKLTPTTTNRYASEREANRQRVDNGLRAAMDVVARENGF